MNNSLIVDTLDIRELSDDELASRLQVYGFSAGPIVETTRAVYQRKLARLMRNEEMHLSTEEDATSEEEEEKVENKEQYEGLNFSNLSYTSCDMSSPYRIDALTRRPLSRTEGQQWDSPYASTPKASHMVYSSPPSSAKGKDSGIPNTYKIIGAVVLLLFILIIYHNMESSGINPVPPSMDD